MNGLGFIWSQKLDKLIKTSIKGLKSYTRLLRRFLWLLLRIGRILSKYLLEISMISAKRIWKKSKNWYQIQSVTTFPLRNFRQSAKRLQEYHQSKIHFNSTTKIEKIGAKPTKYENRKKKKLYKRRAQANLWHRNLSRAQSKKHHHLASRLW